MREKRENSLSVYVSVVSSRVYVCTRLCVVQPPNPNTNDLCVGNVDKGVQVDRDENFVASFLRKQTIVTKRKSKMER